MASPWASTSRFSIRTSPTRKTSAASAITRSPRLKLRLVIARSPPARPAWPGNAEKSSVAAGRVGALGDDRRGPTRARLLRPLHRLAFLVVRLLDVDLPDVVVGAEEVLHGQEGRVHRVVLVVVLVHPVAPHGVHVGGVVGEPGPQHVDVLLVGLVVGGV